MSLENTGTCTPLWTCLIYGLNIMNIPIPSLAFVVVILVWAVLARLLAPLVHRRVSQSSLRQGRTFALLFSVPIFILLVLDATGLI